ncbi:MAG: MFS transporter [Alphaproteobacteria bacterium]|nr:MFS transporter [Alphaproteobacteria bacterium]
MSLSVSTPATAEAPSLRGFFREFRGVSLVVFLTCLIGWSLSSMDSSLFGYAIPGIREEFGAGIDDVGWVLSASFVFAAFTSAAIGILTDTYGRRRMFMVCLAASALLVGMHAFVIGLVSLTVLRMFAFGIGNGLSPITNSYVAETAPNRYRGMLIALLQCGYPIGWFVAALFVAPLISTFGWRYIFMPALLVIPVAFLLVRYLPESARFQAARAEEKGQGQGGFVDKLKELFSPALRLRTILIGAIFFLYGGAYAGTAFYFPSYFNEFRGYSMEEATEIVGLSYGVGVFGYFAVAILGEFYMTRRNVCLLWAALGSIAVLGLLWLPRNFTEDAIGFAVMSALLYANAASLTMLLAESFPTRVRATAAGFAGSFMLNIGHAVFPVAVAAAIKSIGWQWAFTLAVVPPLVIIIGALLMLPNYKSGIDLDEISK